MLFNDMMFTVRVIAASSNAQIKSVDTACVFAEFAVAVKLSNI